MKRTSVSFMRLNSKRAACDHPGNYFVPIIENIKHSVLSIETIDKKINRKNESLFSFLLPASENKMNITKSFGTGFIIHPKGYILTSEHVVHHAKSIVVRLYGGEQRTAKVIWSDPKRDLAILETATRRSLRPLPIGSSTKSKVGEFVISIGNPLGLDHTVTKGIISAKNRPVRISNKLYEDIIQTDCAINPGNSGGPLVNLNGEVIGMNAFIIKDNQGLGFAVGIDGIKERAKKYVQ